VRKAGATRLAESGASIPEIMAWGGWKTMSEVQRYTEAAPKTNGTASGRQAQSANRIG
jgi:hypothetical protein